MSASAPYRCPTCQNDTLRQRNLVVFIDGTSNKPGDKNTNVMKLYNQVISSTEDLEPQQCKKYWRGIGTHPKNLPPLNRVGKEIHSWFEMAFAWNVEKNVRDAYAWLAETYREGDRIYLFGFSRGAYQVRVLASMIHEVGLVKGGHTDMAYDHYLSIHPYNPKTREEATKFKKDFCWQGVRIHFVGVWDTVSSIGLIKKDVFVSASAAETNSCHFRHALALDEHRVKFMPEYFIEMNAHHSNIRTRKFAKSDVKEVWFAGSHSDVGGINRPDTEPNFLPEEDDHTNHAGNVPLQWMRREATTQGLVFNPELIFWDPDDVDSGRKDTMSGIWKSLEILPIRHQVSFSGSGKHKCRWHLSRPRRVIPEQQIHASVQSRDVYTPSATLGDGIDVPTVPCDGLWTTELPDEVATTAFLTSLLSDQRKTQDSLEKVIFLLDSWVLVENERIQAIPWPQWSETFIRGNFALIVIHCVASSFSLSEGLVEDARKSLRDILSRSNETECREALFVLRFITRHEILRRRFVAPDVIEAVVRALEWIVHRPGDVLFPSVIDSLCHLIQDDDLRDNVIHELSSRSSEAGTEKTRLSLALEVEEPKFLMASLKVITSVARHQSGSREELKPKIVELAVKRSDSVGPAAVEALVALNVPVPPNVHFSNILGYLCNALPRIDVEGGTSSSSDNIGSLPAVLQVNGSGGLDGEVMRKLVLTVKSNDARKRTMATLTLLKLCGNSEIRKYVSDNDVADVFIRQLEKKETSLLASYALRTCLDYVDIAVNVSRVAPLIFTMIMKDWFDDAVGRVEGFGIFHKLMMSGNLRQEVVNLGIVDALEKKLEDGAHNEVRASLICLGSLGAGNPDFLNTLVDKSLTYLKHRREKIQTKGVKILSALAQTLPGEEAIKPRVTEIVKMLSERPRSQLFGPAAALYDLSKNETLREQIRHSEEFATFKHQRRATARRTS